MKNNCNLDTERIKEVITCPNCGYKMKEFKGLKCPRCNSYLFEKCSECNKCSLFK